MSILGYISTTIIAFSGLAAGIIVSNLAKNELKQGRKYFVILQKILLAISFAFAVFSLNSFFNLNAAIAIIIAALAALVLLKFRLSSYAAYPLLGLCVYASSSSAFALAVQSAVFIYGFPTASLNPRWKEILYNSGFIITALFPALLSLL